MIKRVRIKNFKQFEDETFELNDSVVLAGPNNSGKSTLLQAMATWSLAFNKWKSQGDRKRKNRMNFTRPEFLSVPLRHFNLLWTDTSTALKRDEGGGRGLATPRLIHITLEGTDEASQEWQHTMELRYVSSDVIYIKEILPPGAERPQDVDSIKIVHIPSFSGIGVDEEVHRKEMQDLLIGQGKPGDIIRNLLLDVAQDETAWNSMVADIEGLFDYTLLKPDDVGRAHILCEYKPSSPSLRVGGKRPVLDIASAGSGFLQTLLILAFIYAREATMLLVDEPDAHSHVSLQKQVYDYLKAKAAENKCQLVIATHSEIIIDKTDPEQIISFYQNPHRLAHEAERDGMREALKMLSNMDILQAEQGRVLYTEDNSDLNILLAWAERLNHRLSGWLSSREVFHYPIKGNNVKFTKHHFFALHAIKPEIVGAFLLDSDNLDPEEHEISSRNLEIFRWRRYEIENYLVHPDAIKRFIQSHFEQNRNFPLFEKTKAEKAVSEMYRQIPKAVTDEPLGEHDFFNDSGMSKGVLPKILSDYIPKSEYYKIAQVMLPEEIHPEVTEKLDAIATALAIPETPQNPKPKQRKK